MHGGIENDVYRVRLRSGPQAVARVYRTKTPQQVAGELALLTRLQGHVLCPRPLAPRFGTNSAVLGNRPLALTDFLVGEHVKRCRFMASMFTQFGRSLKGLHQRSSGRCFRRCFDMKELVLCGRSLVSRFAEAEEYGAFTSLLDRELAFVESLQSDDFRDGAMLHADVDEGNIIRGGQGRLWLLDFDDCTFGPPILDLGITLRNLVVKRLVRNPDEDGMAVEDAAIALLGGYGVAPEPAQLGTWLRVACVRHWLLMMRNSLSNPAYPSKNADNVNMLRLSWELEDKLNALRTPDEAAWESASGDRSQLQLTVTSGVF